jgi:hypothetical protein
VQQSPRRQALLTGTLIALVLAVGQMLPAQLAVDLASSVGADPQMAQPGGSVTVLVDYTNLSSIPPNEAIVALELPPTLGLDWDPPTIESIEESFSDTLGNNGSLHLTSTCESLMIQVQGPNAGINLPARTTGTFKVVLPMTADTVRERIVRVDSPPALAADLVHAPGGCDDCSQDVDGNLLSCLGARVRFLKGGPLALAVVDDGSATPTFGCASILNDLTGTIALVRRGTCEFGLKAYNAEAAGALGVIIMNDRAQDLSIFTMGAGEFGPLVTVPVVLVDQQQGDALETAVAGGTPVSATLGGFDSPRLDFRSNVFLTLPPQYDTDPRNNSSSVRVWVGGIFTDGFESGNTSGWIGCLTQRNHVSSGLALEFVTLAKL